MGDNELDDFSDSGIDTIFEAAPSNKDSPFMFFTSTLFSLVLIIIIKSKKEK